MRSTDRHGKECAPCLDREMHPAEHQNADGGPYEIITGRMNTCQIWKLARLSPFVAEHCFKPDIGMTQSGWASRLEPSLFCLDWYSEE